MKQYQDPAITLDGTSLDGFCHSAAVPLTRSETNVTGFQQAFEEFLVGRRGGEITLGIWQDYDVAGIDDLLWDLFNSGDTVELEIKPNEEPGVTYTFRIDI